MVAVLVDTNVLAVADRLHDEVSLDCILACVSCLDEIKRSGVLLLDSRRRIVSEYIKVVDGKRQDGVGSVFLKWVLNNYYSSKIIHVPINEIEPEWFSELQDDRFQEGIDPSDRKFVAVALACNLNPEIFQAVDSEWLLWVEELQKLGIRVRFLCKAEVRRFFDRKFPGRTLPDVV